MISVRINKVREVCEDRNVFLTLEYSDDNEMVAKRRE